MCGSCHVAVNNIGRHISRGRCKEQHVRKKIKMLTPRQREALEKTKNEKPDDN